MNPDAIDAGVKAAFGLGRRCACGMALARREGDSELMLERRSQCRRCELRAAVNARRRQYRFARVATAYRRDRNTGAPATMEARAD